MDCAILFTMEREVIEQKLKEVTEKIVREFQPEKIILFGSRAWGEPRPDSDVDLFIVKESTERRIDRERAVERLLFGSKLPTDVLVYTPDEIKKRLWLEDFFIEKILKSGKILYSAS